MKIKKYEVSDMKEALRMIKEDLGPDAVILSTRKVMKSNNFGLFARPVLEVTAAVEYDGIPLNKQKTSAQSSSGSGYGYESYPSAYTSKTVKKESTSSKNTKAKNTSKIAQTKTKKEDIGNTEIKATPKTDNKNKSTAKSKTDTSKLKNGTTNKSNSTVKKTSTTKEKTLTSKTQKKTVDGKITRTKSK